ncbi:MAG: phospholipase D family protein [Candidatus Bathyarchaeia archaeon]
MNKNSSECIETILNVLRKIRQKVNEKIEKYYDQGDISKAKWISSIQTDILESIGYFTEEKEKILKFAELSQKFKDSPEEMIYLLSIPDIPVTAGCGKRIAEAIAGYKGLGIETIDHKIDEIRYEGVTISEEEIPLSEISMTSFMYRVPPFELTRAIVEKQRDKEITDILGARFVWFVKPLNVDPDSWTTILRKIPGASEKAEVVKGKYVPELGMLVPSEIELVDISNKSLLIEVRGRYPFFLKFGSSQVEKAASVHVTKEKFINYLREKSSVISKDLGPILGNWKLRMDYVYFCYKGLGLSTDPYDVCCPFLDGCPLSKVRGGPCDGRIYWSAKYFKRKFYPKVYPLRRLKVFIKSGFKVLHEEFPDAILKINAYDKRRVENRWYGVEIGTWFIRTRPTIRVFFDTEIGYSIPTSTIELEFSKPWMENFITDIWKEDPEIRSLIATKFMLYKALGEKLDYRKLSSAVISLLDEHSEQYSKFKNYLQGEIDSEIKEFLSRILLHSLKHLLTQYILEKIAGVDMSFVLIKYNYRYSNSIIFAENARNGRIGIIDTVVNLIERNGLAAFILDFANWLKEYLRLHKNDFEKLAAKRRDEAEKTLSASIALFEKGSPSEKILAEHIRKVIEKVRTFKSQLDQNQVRIDITTARTVLLASDIVREEEVEQIEDYFDDILEMAGFHLCLDGCNGCVRLEKYCSEGVQQTLTTSKVLLLKFTERMIDLISRGWSYRTTEAGKLVEPILFSAKRAVDVVSPYISPKYAAKLVELANRGVKVRIVTWVPGEEEKKDFAFQLEALKVLWENLGANLLVRIASKTYVKLPHDKTYIIDDKLITGSFNLTESGLYGNLERVDIRIHPSTIASEKIQFEKLWYESQDLSVNIL